jgi:hypothetical protein
MHSSLDVSNWLCFREIHLVTLIELEQLRVPPPVDSNIPLPFGFILRKVILERIEEMTLRETMFGRGLQRIRDPFPHDNDRWRRPFTERVPFFQILQIE